MAGAMGADVPAGMVTVLRRTKVLVLAPELDLAMRAGLRMAQLAVQSRT